MAMGLVKTLVEIKAMFGEEDRFDFGCIADGMITFTCFKDKVWYNFDFMPKMEEDSLGADVTLFSPITFSNIFPCVDENQYYSLGIVNQEANTWQSADEKWEEHLSELTTT